MVTIALPFPPTINHAKGIGRRKDGSSFMYLNDAPRKFKADAQVAFLMQRKQCGEPIIGNFTYHIVLDEKRRKVARDGDNRGKYVLDFLQSVGLIENDKLADGGSWSWGPVEGCFVRVYPKLNVTAEGRSANE